MTSVHSLLDYNSGTVPDAEHTLEMVLIITFSSFSQKHNADTDHNNTLSQGVKLTCIIRVTPHLPVPFFLNSRSPEDPSSCIYSHTGSDTTLSQVLMSELSPTVSELELGLLIIHSVITSSSLLRVFRHMSVASRMSSMHFFSLSSRSGFHCDTRPHASAQFFRQRHCSLR